MSGSIIEWTEEEIERAASDYKLWKSVLRPSLERSKEWGAVLPFVGRSGNNVVQLPKKRGQKRGRPIKGAVKEEGGEKVVELVAEGGRLSVVVDGRELLQYEDSELGRKRAITAINFIKTLNK